MLLLLRLKVMTYAYVEEKNIINVGGEWCFITKFNILKKLVCCLHEKTQRLKMTLNFNLTEPHSTSYQPLLS